MKTLSIQLTTVLVALAMHASDAQAQSSAETTQTRPAAGVQSSYGLRPHYHMPNPNYYWYRGATAAESYARGLAAMTYARGQYNRLTAEARAIHAEARRYEIENRQQAAATYFAMRQANRAARAAERGPRPSPADLARHAEKAQPKRLPRNELMSTRGEVSWPALLQAEVFAPYRLELDYTFTLRAAHGQIGVEQRAKARQVADAMLEQLKKHVREVEPIDYTIARRFIKSLVLEAQLPVS